MQFPTFSLPSKMDGKRLCLTLLCLISSNPILGLDAEDKCVPIPQCKTLHWMWRHRTEFPSKSPEEVEKFIFSLRCGMDLCPKEQKVRSVRDRNPLIHRRKSPLKRKYEDNIQRACQPHLKLHLYKGDLGPNNLHVQEIHARSAILTNPGLHLYRLENLGSCCWEIYSRPHFRGEKQSLRDQEDQPSILLKAATARVVDC